MPLKKIEAECRSRMDKSIEYFERELRGKRSGRATTALIDYIKVEYYGSPTDLRELAAVSVPEPTRLLVKPFDPTSKAAIVKAVETAELGMNPQVDGEAIRISVPPPSAENRKKLVGQVRGLAEDSRVAIRNERRDAIRHVDQIIKDKESGVSEDLAKDAKGRIDEMTKKHIKKIDELCEKKAREIEEI
ncbi:MAG: ribosome recycling factor [Planctomycetes bacterium]|nr:ribosome recycling factor [Planctomycetota bacterium]